MRALVLAAAIASLLASAAYAEDELSSPLVPATAKSMAMGGVFSAVPTAEASFFGNPAFFAANRPTYALPSLDLWQYGRPSSALERIGSAFAAVGGNDFLSGAFQAISEDGSSGGGASAGLTMSGRGMGLGFFMTTDNRLEGSPGQERISSRTETAIVLGMGFPVELRSALLSIGGDIRPFYRVALRDESGDDPALADVVSEGSKGLYAAAFFGAALDLGASLGFGDWTVGLSVRNIEPAYPVAEDKLTTILNSFGSGAAPEGGYAFDVWTPPAVTAGLSWGPRPAPGKFEPSLYLELGDIVDVARNWDGAESALEMVHAGFEAKILKIFVLRGGFNGGCLSGGFGVKLLCFDLNAALFTEQKWALPGNDSSSGLALQAAIRL